MTATKKTSKKSAKTPSKEKKPTAKQLLAASIRGKYAWIPYSSEDFSRDKQREIALEDRT